ncbi:hypothetical protein [Actinosynnema sp. NPDC023587]|uniref:hypothetical protein n=1 Tax=Actinosynnema sp. NPDC023587 TaxID=3154695 RepID=UPI0033F3EE22
MANSGRPVHPGSWAREVWVRRRWDLCAVVCWQLLLVQFGAVCLVVRAVPVVLGPARSGRTWSERLAPADAVELVLDALGLPGALLVKWAVVVVWLHRRAAARRAGVRGAGDPVVRSGRPGPPGAGVRRVRWAGRRPGSRAPRGCRG